MVRKARQRISRNRTGSHEKPPGTDLEKRWPHIAELADGCGEVSFGRIAGFDCAAIANDESNMLAAIVRRDGESLQALLDRLNEAIGRAADGNGITDEIND
jgi:hypothetical protein